MRDITYYPGCSLKGTAREYDESFRAVSKLLGIHIYELEDWTCCGSTSAHCTDKMLATALVARNLSLAEKHDREIVVPCVACYSRFKAAEQELKEHPENFLFSYKGKAEIRYALDFFCDDILIREIKAKIVKPLTGLKVACYYGCLASRPLTSTCIKRFEDPDHMDRLMEMLGAGVVTWSYKTDCCGASLAMTRTDIVIRLSQRILAAAFEAGADCIVTGCTMCHANLDTRQSGLPPEGSKNEIPIFYFTELMGLALDYEGMKKMMSRHIIDPSNLLSSKGLL